jgi:hypothetical protein
MRNKPATAASPPPSGLPPGLALHTYAAAELDAAIAGLARHGHRLHTGVHHARKGLRRTRAVLLLGGEALGDGARLLARELARVNRDLSALRDAHALIETLDRRIAKHPDVETRPLLRRVRHVAAQRRTERLRAELDADPALAARRQALQVLRAGLDALPWAALQPARLHRALTDSAARADRVHARVHASGDEEDWHRWRRRLRRLSQQLRAAKAAGLAFPAPRAFDKSLAEQLGVAQDLRLLLDQAKDGLPLEKADRTALRRYAKAALAKQHRRIAAIERAVEPPSIPATRGRRKRD